MTSSRVRANNRRREREARQDARETLDRRTTYLTDRTGRTVHVIDWTAEQIAEWKRQNQDPPKPKLSVIEVYKRFFWPHIYAREAKLLWVKLVVGYRYFSDDVEVDIEGTPL